MAVLISKTGNEKADDGITTYGNYDCETSRSIILLTDGVANRICWW